MPHRFALLRHTVPEGFARPSHWDLLLEQDEACWTVTLDELPQGFDDQSNRATVEALRLPDHRKKYLEYEGPVSSERGDVKRVAGGECEWLSATAERICVRLHFNSVGLQVDAERIEGDAWSVRITRQPLS